MYCPKCGTGNLDDIKFCRSCGATLALIPQALTGQLPSEYGGRRRRRDRGTKLPSFEHGLRDTITGLGFIFASIAVFLFAPAGRLWFWSFLFPAFGMLGKGIPEMLAAQKQQPTSANQTHQPPGMHAIPPPPPSVDMRPRTTGEIIQPPSVTESTTKLFDPPQN